MASVTSHACHTIYMPNQTKTEPIALNRSLGPFMLWGMGVGLVISGMYFGWNLGLEQGGTLGFGIATFFVIILYTTFTYSYTELACAIPKAGGAFDYAHKALGEKMGFICGIAQIIEFVFAPPAIAAAIGAYFHIYFPTVPGILIAIIAYVLFTALNIIGVKLAATFELFITLFAVAELLLFAGLTLPHFNAGNFTRNALPHGYSGIFASIPFAIWFFLAIEGLANLAEETIEPQKNIKKGFGWALLTLIVLCILTFVSAVGVDGWERIVYTPSGETSDSPLPLALSAVLGSDHLLYHLLIGIGLMGLVASFHGIILAAGRATFEFGRVGYFPRQLAKLHPLRKTPANALIVNMLVGIVALLTGKTGEIITIACMGALSLYIISMLSLFALRKKFPQMDRPFKVPFYPVFPAVALLIASVAFVAVCIYNPVLTVIYIAILCCTYAAYFWWLRHTPKRL
jgi:ethanolamine permease